MRGVGCFMVECDDSLLDEFPSPCGVWVVSVRGECVCRACRFRPLAGCGLFPSFPRTP